MMSKYDVSESGNLTKAELAALMQELSGEMQDGASTSYSGT
jgi:hypothetical protein